MASPAFAPTSDLGRPISLIEAIPLSRYCFLVAIPLLFLVQMDLVLSPKFDYLRLLHSSNMVLPGE